MQSFSRCILWCILFFNTTYWLIETFNLPHPLLKFYTKIVLIEIWLLWYQLSRGEIAQKNRASFSLSSHKKRKFSQAFYTKLRCDRHYFWIPLSILFEISSFKRGCVSLEDLFASSLNCFYGPQCINSFIATMPFGGDDGSNNV